jgi:hypothetical protein
MGLVDGERNVMSDEKPSKGKGWIGTLGVGVAAVGAFILAHASEEFGKQGGEYLGISLFFPLVVVFLCCWVARKVLSPDLQDLSIAIGIVSAQVLLHVLGGLYFGVLTSVLLDIVVLSIGLAWLIIRPSVWPIIGLTGFEILALGTNLVVLTQVTDTVGAVKGLLSFMLIRLAAIIFLIVGYRSLKAKPTIAVAPSDATSEVGGG